jgi:cytochrome c553
MQARKRHPKLSLFVIAVVVLPAGLFSWLDSSTQAAQPTDDAKIEFFESRIRPVLATSCYDCHTDAAKGGLRVDSREALLKGGQRGAAIVIGKPEESLLIKAIAHTHESLRMPKGAAKLKEEEIADLSQWIKDGAVWPQTTAKNSYLIKQEHKTFWSFQPIRNPAVPIVKGVTNNPIDAFLLAQLEAKGLTFNPPADKRTLLRRVTYDLTGLPPTSEELRAFIDDTSPDAFARVVDRLLDSATYGERWARHWLDLARYSDTLGMIDAGKNLQGWFPYAYTYRDWVIRAFNQDLPYDQFIIQQIAADKVPNNEPKNLAALGFLSLTRGGLGVTRPDKIDDKIDVVTRGLMGLTVSCARCHNHKFDPIPTADYYSLYTIFSNSREPKTLPLLDPKNAELKQWEAEMKTEEASIEVDIRKMREKRYPELKALYRTEPEITKALLMVYGARQLKTDDELEKFGQEKDYNVYMLKRWRTYLQRADEVWAIWRGFADLPEKEFKERAGPALSSLATRKVNQLVAESFKPPPGSIREAAETYARLLVAYDKPQPLKNAEEEQLRQVLHAEDAPTAMPFDDYEKFRLSTDKQNEDGRRRKLESLFLAQAYRGAPPRAQSLEDEPEPKPGFVFLRGKPENKGEAVRPQFLLILAGDKRKPFTSGSGRLELAQAIVSKDNPLTARVLVNRLWQHHFGRGLVRTSSDFGTRGEAPAHPQLLDYLAYHFIKNGWSIKRMHRLLLLSRAYQQSSADHQTARHHDPENKMLWRMDRRRLEIEELRDSLLVASGKLDRRMFGLPVSAQSYPYTYRRTIYSFIDRALVPNDFRIFDFADPNTHVAERSLTTVPQQALFMLNSPFVIEQAKAVMQRPEVSSLKDPAQRISKLYQLIYGRSPGADEIALGLKYLAAENKKRTEKTSTGMNALRAEMATPANVPGHGWQYGEGEYDDKADRVKTFNPLEHFINGQWRNSPMPGDPRETTASLTARGGSLGDSKAHSALRRWVAPFDGKISITGLLEHSFENGCKSCKGAYVRVVSSRSGTAGKWDTVQGKIETSLASLEVRRGETLDFVAEAGKGTAGGEFKWAVKIRRLDGRIGEWDSVRDFRRPSAGLLNAWDRYVQTLFATAEFFMID